MERTPMRAAAEAVARSLARAGHLVYFAGGCVRDRLMGYPVKDIDIATSARPDEVLRLFPGSWEVGAAFGVVLVLHKGFCFEVATFRKDGNYSDGRRPDAVYFTDAREDARRRDFTMNGLFEEPFSDPPGGIVDYVDGVADIEAGILRAIGNPDCRFEEDSLRLMRAVRFAVTREVAMEAETYASVCRNSGLLARIAPERIREELDRILLAPRRRAGVEMLVETGLMKHIIPEVYAMVDCGQPPQWHPEGDVYTHTLMMLEALGTDGGPVSLELALAVLLHDIGKPACREVDETGRIRFSGHDKEGAALARVILRRLKYSNAVVDAAVTWWSAIRVYACPADEEIHPENVHEFPLLPGRTGAAPARLPFLQWIDGYLGNSVRDARESYRQEPWCRLLATGRPDGSGIFSGTGFQKMAFPYPGTSTGRHAAEQEGGLAAAGPNCPGGSEYTCRVPGKTSIINGLPSCGRKRASPVPFFFGEGLHQVISIHASGHLSTVCPPLFQHGNARSGLGKSGGKRLRHI